MLRVIPLEAAEYAHHMIDERKDSHKQAATLQSSLIRNNTRRCSSSATRSFLRTQIPGVPSRPERPSSSICLPVKMTTTSSELGGGLKWLDSHLHRPATAKPTSTARRSSKRKFSTSSPTARMREQDESLASAAWSSFRCCGTLTADGFFTSKIGIQYLGYVGNTFLPDFPGCPPVPGT